MLYERPRAKLSPVRTPPAVSRRPVAPRPGHTGVVAGPRTRKTVPTAGDDSLATSFLSRTPLIRSPGWLRRLGSPAPCRTQRTGADAHPVPAPGAKRGTRHAYPRRRKRPLSGEGRPRPFLDGQERLSGADAGFCQVIFLGVIIWFSLFPFFN